MRRLRPILALSAWLALACGSSAPSPQQVTRDFWEAVRTGDSEAAQALATPGSARRIDGLAQGRPIEEVLLGDTLEGEDAAIVHTSLVTSVNDSPIHTAFDTHLVREDGHWRVDVPATERALTAAIFASTVDLLGNAVGQGMREFSQAVDDGLAEISQAIREALEELDADLQSRRQ